MMVCVFLLLHLLAIHTNIFNVMLMEMYFKPIVPFMGHGQNVASDQVHYLLTELLLKFK